MNHQIVLRWQHKNKRKNNNGETERKEENACKTL